MEFDPGALGFTSWDSRMLMGLPNIREGSSSISMNKLPKTELGDLLKQWRGVRGRSQLDVSVDTGISQRQISFIESGRSVPGRATLMGIAQALEIPLRERN